MRKQSSGCKYHGGESYCGHLLYTLQPPHRYLKGTFSHFPLSFIPGQFLMGLMLVSRSIAYPLEVLSTQDFLCYPWIVLTMLTEGGRPAHSGWHHSLDLPTVGGAISYVNEGCSFISQLPRPE